MTTLPIFSENSAFVAPRAVRELLAITRQTEGRMRERGVLPPIYLMPGTGRVWRYRAEELDEALAKIFAAVA